MILDCGCHTGDGKADQTRTETRIQHEEIIDPVLFHPHHHNSNVMMASTFDGRFESYKNGIGIPLGEDPDDAEILEVGQEVSIMSTPFNYASKHYTGLKADIVGRDSVFAKGHTHQKDSRRMITTYEIRNCKMDQDIYIPFTRSDLFHPESSRPALQGRQIV